MQQDLFTQPKQWRSVRNEERSDVLDKHRVYFRLDQALLGFIVLLVLFALCFSFGVEHGKRVMKRQVGEIEVVDTIAEVSGVTSTAIELPPPVVIPPMIEIDDSPYPKGNYTIQSVTYTTKQAAETEIRRLLSSGHQGFVIPSGKYHQVCIDSFETKNKAQVALSQLKSQRLVPGDAYVRAIPG